MDIGAQPKTELIDMRPACATDEKLLWEWANDPIVRQASFRSRPIPWEDHQQWFARNLSSPTTRIFIAEMAGEPIAQVRFELKGGGSLISMSLSAKVRGRRYGCAILQRAIREIFRTSDIDHIVALIKADNPVSERAFVRAGFVYVEETLETGQPARKFILQREWCPA